MESLAVMPSDIRLGDTLPGVLGRTLPAGTQRQGEPQEVELPATVGRYRIIGRLGSGSMGTVFSAFDADLERRIAIKMVRAPKGLGVEMSEWLLKEARALARLEHPNIVRVYEVGTFRGELFVAMELVHGCTLGEWIANASPAWREVLSVMVQAGRALQAAHTAGIIHREHKPRPRNPAPNTGAPPISSDPAELRG